MITVIRQTLKGNGFRFLLVFMLTLMGGALILSPMLDQSDTVKKTNWALKVNDSAVPFDQFNREYMSLERQFNMIRQYSTEYFDYLIKTQGTAQQITIDSFVTKKLYQQVAENAPFKIHPSYMAEMLKNKHFIQESGIGSIFPPYLIDEKGVIDGLQLKLYLKQVNLSMAQFEHMLEEAFEQSFAEAVVAAGGFVPKALLNEYIESMYGLKQFAILQWSLQDIVKNEVSQPISGEVLLEFFNDQNKKYKRYWEPERRSGSMWRLPADRYGVTVSENAVEAYYLKNRKDFVDSKPMTIVRHILFKVESDEVESDVYAKAQDVLEKAKKDPHSFAELAQKYSEDDLSANSGGLLPPFSKGMIDQSTEQLVGSLHSPGDISNVFKSKDGFEIMQLVERSPIVYKELTVVSDEIKNKLLKDEMKKQFLQDVKSLSSNPTKEQLDMFVQSHNGNGVEKIQETEKTSTSKVKTLFSIPQVGGFLYNFDNNGAYLVMLEGVVDEYEADIQSIQEQVAEDLYYQRAQKSLDSLIQQAKIMVKSAPIESVARDLGGNLIYTDYMKSSDANFDSSFKQWGIPKDKLFSLEKVGFTQEHSDDRNGFLIQFCDKKQIQEEGQKQKDEAIGKLLVDNLSLIQSAFIASLRKGATIKINDSIIQ